MFENLLEIFVNENTSQTVFRNVLMVNHVLLLLPHESVQYRPNWQTAIKMKQTISDSN